MVLVFSKIVLQGLLNIFLVISKDFDLMIASNYSYYRKTCIVHLLCSVISSRIYYGFPGRDVLHRKQTQYSVLSFLLLE